MDWNPLAGGQLWNRADEKAGFMETFERHKHNWTGTRIPSPVSLDLCKQMHKKHQLPLLWPITVSTHRGHHLELWEIVSQDLLGEALSSPSSLPRHLHLLDETLRETHRGHCLACQPTRHLRDLMLGSSARMREEVQRSSPKDVGVQC